MAYRRPCATVKAINFISANLGKQELTRCRLMEIKGLHSFMKMPQSLAGSKDH